MFSIIGCISYPKIPHDIKLIVYWSKLLLPQYVENEKKNIAHVSCHDIGAKLKGKKKKTKRIKKKRKRENENDFQSDICRTCVTDYVSEHTGHSSLETYLSLGSSTSSIRTNNILS